jgi:ABC-type transport system involved in cytochrome c biogenesis permease subunit
MLAVAFYGLSMIYSVFLWRKGFRQDNRVNYVLLLIAFGFHTSAMMLRGFSLNHCPVTNLYEATTFAEWTIAAVYLAVGLWSRLRFLGAFASPFLFGMGVFALMPGLDPPKGTFEAAAGTWTSLHAALMSLAYGAFGLSSVAALMYLTQEHNLKFHKLHAIFSLLPPIQRLEVIVVRTLFAGFILLTVGLLIGGYDLACTSNPQSHRGDPKIVWSALVWLLYLGLIIMRWKFAQGGRRFALGAIGSFAFVLLTFWGSNLLSPLHNPRAPTGPKEPTQAFYNHTRLGNATWQPAVSPIGSWVIALTKLDPAGHQPAIQPTTSRRYGGYVNRHRLAERPLKSCRSLFLG